MGPTSRDILVRPEDDALVVHLLCQSLVFNDDIERVSKAMDRAVEESRASAVVVEFSAVRQVSSGLISKILALDRRLKEQKRRLILCGLRTDVLEVFNLLRLNKLFEIVKDEYIALDEAKDG